MRELDNPNEVERAVTPRLSVDSVEIQDEYFNDEQEVDNGKEKSSKES